MVVFRDQSSQIRMDAGLHAERDEDTTRAYALFNVAADLWSAGESWRSGWECCLDVDWVDRLEVCHHSVILTRSVTSTLRFRPTEDYLRRHGFINRGRRRASQRGHVTRSVTSAREDFMASLPLPQAPHFPVGAIIPFNGRGRS